MQIIAFLACLSVAADPAAVLFTESFDDARLADRGWYDLTGTRIVEDAKAGAAALSSSGRPAAAT
jgi:hypothetical protein